MSRRGSDPVVFPDASSCFSEEEWDLLQQWQKELYRNVMKEIHQALMSLGPLIATTVCSLSAKEKQDLCPQGRQKSSRRQRSHTTPGGQLTNTGVSSTVCREDATHLKKSKETAGTGKNVCQNPESPILVDDQCVTEEPGVIIIDPIGPEEADSTNLPNPGFPVVTAVYSLCVNDENTVFKEAPAGTFRAEPVVNSEQKKTLLSQEVVRNSTDTLCTDINPTHQQKPEPSRCSVQQGAGVKRKRRQKRNGDSLKGSENPQQAKAASRKNSTNEMHNSQMETNSTGQDWSLGSETRVQCGSKANELAKFILSLGTPNIGFSDTYGDCGSNPGSSLVSKVQPKTKQKQPSHTSTKCDNTDSITAQCSGLSEMQSRDEIYACSECDESFFSNDNLVKHHKTHTGEKTHKCSECGMCFHLKTQLVKHYEVHSGTKKYQCMFCPKGYDQKHNIDGHIRTHTGEKPYKCPECKKEFTWRSGLVEHKKRHEAHRKAEKSKRQSKKVAE